VYQSCNRLCLRANRTRRNRIGSYILKSYHSLSAKFRDSVSDIIEKAALVTSTDTHVHERRCPWVRTNGHLDSPAQVVCGVSCVLFHNMRDAINTIRQNKRLVSLLKYNKIQARARLRETSPLTFVCTARAYRSLANRSGPALGCETQIIYNKNKRILLVAWRR
jgi:hypothetical protein